tara:strand:+ start:12703 stop:13398 length:696 start_codon:yes stop_codon:yes gene_type:complete
MHIAVIPARANSKRIKNKNIISFHGKPIIYYSILTAIDSGLFDRVIVSTDSKKIAKISRKYGAETPFLRKKCISDDKTSVKEVVKDVIHNLSSKNKHINCVTLIYPCAPLLKKSTLKKAYKTFINTKAGYVFSISKYSSKVQRALILTKNNMTKSLQPKFEKTNSQDLVDTYYDSGQFVIGKTKYWLKDFSVHNNGEGFILNYPENIDIDNNDDLDFAKFAYENLYSKKLK